MYGLDLFSGIGGLTKALERITLDIVPCELDEANEFVRIHHRPPERNAEEEMKEMKFSDDDLKRLKESIPNTPDPENQRAKLFALLARLECAEKAMNFMWISAHPVDESAKEAYDEWRKAAGRDK